MQSYICTRNLHRFCSVAVNQENTAEYTRSIPPMPLTVRKQMHVEYVNESNLFLRYIIFCVLH
jgi:hypothetical protein